MQEPESRVSTRHREALAAGGPESPAAERNKEAILAVLRRVLPATGTVLEIASGTGQHIEHFARGLPNLTWQPSEPDADLRAAVAARVAAADLPNLRAPLALDVRDENWPVESAAAVVCINMIHIAPWAATAALFAHARQLLAPPAVLALYGPYKRRGAHTAPSNAAFDASLQRRNPDWGVRDLDTVGSVAAARGFALREVVEMPANNFTVIFQRSAQSPTV
jgi:SAM-dependent methyltransferase